MPLIAFGEWTPDQPDLGAGAIEALNVIPAARSYDPFPDFGATSTTPLSAKCQGSAAFRSSSGVIGFYAGDASKLYLLSSTAWTDASKVGGYSTDPAGRWVAVSFGALALFTNGIDPIQKITIDGGAIFADLGGTPPVCRYLAVCRGYVVAAWLSTDATAAQWCATENPESWPIGSSGGDVQSMPDNGQVTGVVGGDFFLVFLERGVHRFDFVGGDIVFQRRQIGFGVGCSMPGTVQAFNDRAFFYHETGFYECLGGGTPTPIGDQRVNQYFKDQLSSGGRDFIFSAIDPVNSIYAVGFCSDGGAGFSISEILLHKWDAGPAGRWTHVISGVNYEILFSGLSAVNMTLEGLDIYGSLEAVPFPLDSPVWLGEGNELFGAFNSSHNSGWFNAASMEATLTTTEAILIDGQKSLVRGYRPQVTASTAITMTGTVYARDLLSAAAATNANSQSKAANSNGLIRARIKGRYHRATITIAAGALWEHAIGIDDLEFKPMGTV